MSAILIPSRRLVQPQGITRVDHNNHAGDKARFLLNFGSSWTDAVQGWSPIDNSAFPIESGSHGVGLAAQGQNGLRYKLNPTEIQFQETTIVVVSEINTFAGNGGTVIARNRGSATPSWGLGTHRGSANGWSVKVGASGSSFEADPIQLISSAAIAIPACQVLTLANGVATLYVNGANAGVRTYIGDLVYDRTDTGIAILRAGANNSSAFRGVVYCAGVLEGALSDDAAKDLSLNPWQMFKTEPSRFYSIANTPIPKVFNVPGTRTTQPQGRVEIAPEFESLVKFAAVGPELKPIGGTAALWVKQEGDTTPNDTTPNDTTPNDTTPNVASFGQGFRTGLVSHNRHNAPWETLSNTETTILLTVFQIHSLPATGESCVFGDFHNNNNPSFRSAISISSTGTVGIRSRPSGSYTRGGFASRNHAIGDVVCVATRSVSNNYRELILSTGESFVNVDSSQAGQNSVASFSAPLFSGGAIDVTIGMAVVIQGDLTSEDIRRLVDNPWQIFKADPVKIYSIANTPIPKVFSPSVKRTTQPQGRVEIDQSSGFAEGLVFASTGDRRMPCLVSGAFPQLDQSLPSLGEMGLARDVSGAVGTTYPNSQLLTAPRSALTLTAWVYIPTGSLQENYATICAKDWSTPRTTPWAQYGFLARELSGYGFSFATVVNGNTNRILFPGYATDQWLCIVGVLDGTQRRAYVNGVLRASDFLGQPLPVSSGTFNLGQNSANAERFSGIIGPVNVSSRAWSGEEVAEYYRNPWQLFKADPVRIYSLPSNLSIPSDPKPPIQKVFNVPRRQITQPQGRVALAPEWGDAWTAWLGSNPTENLGNGPKFAPIGDRGREELNPHGVGLRSTGYNQPGWMHSRSGNPHTDNWPGVTVVADIHFARDLGSGDYPGISSFAPSGEFYGGWNLTAEHNGYRFFFARCGDNPNGLTLSGNYGVTSSTNEWAVGDHFRLVMTYSRNPSYIRLYGVRNGGPVIMTSRENVPSSWRNATSLENIGGYFRQSVFRSFVNPINSVSVFPYAIDDSVVRELLVNPYQIYKPDPVRIYSLPTGLIQRRSIVFFNSSLSEMPVGMQGTGLKPLVLLNGRLQQRVGSEGFPVTLDNGRLRTLAADEELII